MKMHKLHAVAAVAALALWAGPVAADTVGSACTGGPPESTKLVVMNDWLPVTQQAPLWEAKHKGFYKDEGLEVELIAPANPADPIKLVAMKRVNFSITYVPEIMISQELTIPVVSVAIMLQPISSGLLFMPRDDIKTAADLKGKILGVGTKRDAQAYLASVLEAGGLTRKDVKVVDPGWAGLALLMAGKIDVTHALTFSEQLTLTTRLKKEGKPAAKILLYKDYGVPPFAYTLLAANRDWLQANPQTTCRFLKATLKGMKSVLAKPDETIDFITKARPGALTMDENRAKWNAHKDMYAGKDGKFLVQHLDTWELAQSWGLKRKLVNAPVGPASEYFTNAYLPKQ